jgi:hypothetical protein
VWRKSDEGLVEEATRMRWKGYSEFMFWSYFSYYRKGPCHIWKPETAAEPKVEQDELDAWNKIAEPIYEAIFE